jgi:transcriptional regulator with XRE-family HTH domain
MNVTFSMLADRPGRDVQETLAANLRRLRIARRLSLSELARATAMSKATLSGIENGRANPTVETLAGLAAALRISVTELLDELPLGEIRIERRIEARFGRRDGIAHRLLEAFAAPVELGELALDARQRQEVDPKAAGARTSVYVLEGTLIAGPVERSTELGRGDYMSFPADVPHVFEAGRQAARALSLTQIPD